MTGLFSKKEELFLCKERRKELMMDSLKMTTPERFHDIRGKVTFNNGLK